MDEDQIALESVRSGDQSALQELMGRHKQTVFRIAYRYLNNQEDAEEVTEETFVRVYFRSEQYEPRASVRTWICSIAANLCRDSLRKRKRRGQTETFQAYEDSDTLFNVADNVADSALQSEHREILQKLEKAIHQLPHKLKFPFLFCVLEENSHEACAEALGVSVKSVETRIYRARRRLREAVAED